MKVIAKITALVALVACTPVSTGALNQEALLQRGLTQMTGQQIAAQYVGNTCQITAYDSDGNVVGNGTNTYRTNGTVTKTNTPLGGEPVTRERTWRMSGGNFCETLFRSGDEWCGGHEVFWQLEDTMYTFHDNGAVQNEINCS
ncbi:hypothetical protein ACVDG3_15300 [Meridianimarinicoccus sp. RP-17]|uniref:hypothetical protein n=1 Tax=Meridianimarinicoccus zhengii TaxID=2056810 RepID=UPI0013A6EB3B|nr:hypothetical protein [Phycocomes zhengii]